MKTYTMLNRTQRHGTYGEVEVYLHVFLTSSLDGGEWSVSHPGQFTPSERAAGTYLIEGERVPEPI